MYAKLFTSIYQGTLRGNSHGLLVFTNLLAHCDKTGVCDMHPKAIAEEVGLSVGQVRVALDELEAPDIESRSPEEDGRRIIRLDAHRAWGWQVVNYLKYRSIRDEDDRREQNRLSQERWRNKHKPASADVTTSQPAKPESAHTEAEVEVKADKDISTAAQSHPAKPRKRGSAGGVGFDLLWAQYPKKQAKAAAIKAFDKLAPSAELLDDLLQAIAKQRTWPQWTREGGQFVPMLATWINNRRWEDELARHGHEPSETPRQRAARARVAEMTGGLMGSEPYQPRGSDYDEVGRSPVHATIDALR